MNYHNTQSQDTSRLSNNSRAGPSRRPATISELAERANIPWDESKGFKYHLKLAEKHRREGKEYARSGDMENAFVELAKAATLVLERLPEHPDYNARLNPNQRHNLGLVCNPFFLKKTIFFSYFYVLLVNCSKKSNPMFFINRMVKKSLTILRSSNLASSIVTKNGARLILMVSTRTLHLTFVLNS